MDPSTYLTGREDKSMSDMRSIYFSAHYTAYQHPRVYLTYQTKKRELYAKNVTVRFIDEENPMLVAYLYQELVNYYDRLNNLGETSIDAYQLYVIKNRFHLSKHLITNDEVKHLDTKFLGTIMLTEPTKQLVIPTHYSHSEVFKIPMLGKFVEKDLLSVECEFNPDCVGDLVVRDVQGLILKALIDAPN